MATISEIKEMTTKDLIRIAEQKYSKIEDYIQRLKPTESLNKSFVPLRKELEKRGYEFEFRSGKFELKSKFPFKI